MPDELLMSSFIDQEQRPHQISCVIFGNPSYCGNYFSNIDYREG